MNRDPIHPDVDVFISNYTLVDPDVYLLWVNGYSSADAVTNLNLLGITKSMNVSIDLLASDVLDHYRTYSLLERLLHNPTKLVEQKSFQMNPSTVHFLIEKYYEFDDQVIRELLGKKLSSRHRKDLDEVADKAEVLLKSCRRQFDNIKRVFKTVEELSGRIVQNIRTNFLLPEELARRYGAVVFLGCMRFETSKRKLQYLTFQDFHLCAESIMAHWTYSESSPEYSETELDREFLLDLREVRVLVDKEKEHKHLVCARLKPQLLERTMGELDANFRTYSRAIVGLACSLHRTRDLRQLFTELVERCLEPWRMGNWSHSELRNFLNVYSQSALEMDVLRETEMKRAWERFMAVITVCILRMYHT